MTVPAVSWGEAHQSYTLTAALPPLPIGPGWAHAGWLEGSGRTVDGLGMRKNVAAFRTGAGRVAPFGGACVLAWVAVLVDSSIVWWQYALSVVVALLAGLLALLAARSTRLGWLGVVPSSLLLLMAVGLVRNSAGGITSGASALAILPVFQTALYSRSRRDLFLVLAGLALFFVIPVLLIGPPAYPHTQYRAALLVVAVDGIIGLATQRLVANARYQAREARSNERMIEQVSEIVHGLLDSPHVRADVCQAALRSTQATIALLYEPGDLSGLHCTAVAGLEIDPAGISVKKPSAVYSAFESGRSVLITQDVEAWVGSLQLWIAAGRPASILCQPLVKDGVVLGVLAMGWPGSIREKGPRATVAAMLAHEAAGAIARADAMHHLADEAQTDALTGLPNRRAWDAHLKRAATDLQAYAIAILDLDHFKQFNDTHGHPAGDLLLKETAAAWRDQLRGFDVLARIGGEEFGLLLPDCDAATAQQVTNRLSCRVARGRTCSAGIAVREPSETTEAVVARADEALYEAKTRGRDQTHLDTTFATTPSVRSRAT
jgi:diguanylate cyclase (GGDEF)-like protein